MPVHSSASTFVLSALLVLGGCSSSSDGSAAGGAGKGSGASGGGSAASGGGSGATGGGSGATGGGSGASGGGSGATGGAAPGSALPTSAFLYVSSKAKGQDVLMAYDTKSKKTAVVTDLTGDGSSGWPIDGVALSPDRTRVAVATLYRPTKADNDTGIATNRIWTFALDGSAEKRLTPVFPNTGAGKSNFTIDVRAPVFSRDGAQVLFDYGEYWYEGTTLKGATSPFWVSAQGSVPVELPVAKSCLQVTNPAIVPTTGEIVAIHSICLDNASAGIWLYPAAGGDSPKQLVSASVTSPYLGTPSIIFDGSGFLFIGTPAGGNNTLYLYDFASATITPIIAPKAPNTGVSWATVNPDATAVVYVLRQDTSYDLHLIDLTVKPATDTALTTDGISKSPVW